MEAKSPGTIFVQTPVGAQGEGQGMKLQFICTLHRSKDEYGGALEATATSVCTTFLKHISFPFHEKLTGKIYKNLKYCTLFSKYYTEIL